MKIRLSFAIFFVCLFSCSLSVWASDQAIVWNDYQLISDKSAISLNDIIWDEDQYIAVGDGGWIAVSKTGSDWDYRKLTSDDIKLTMVSSLNEYVFVIGCKEGKEKQYSRFIYKKDKYGELSLSSSGTEGNLHYDLISIAKDNNNNLISVGGKYIDYKPFGLILKASLRSLFREIDNCNNSAALSTYLNSVTWGKNKFIAVGMKMKIIASSDGDTWEDVNLYSALLTNRRNNINLNQVIWNGVQFIAVGDQATILASKDGLSWRIIKNNLEQDRSIQSITSAGNHYIITGENGFCASSTDLKRWQKIKTKIYDDFQKVSSSGNNIVVITNKSSMLVGTIKVNTIPINSGILVNKRNTNLEAYGVGGNTYFKLRDIAAIFNGTSKQFDVSWDKADNIISLVTGKSYQNVGGELKSPGKTEIGTTTIKATAIMFNGKKVSLTAFTIGGNNYFKLRDLGKLLDFDVLWNKDLNCVEINSSLPYIP